jgi:hypothetical protein
MEELEAIWNMRSYERSRSYARNLAAVFQPCSYSEFNAHPDFDEAFQRWTQNDRHRGLDAIAAAIYANRRRFGTAGSVTLTEHGD